MATNEINMSSRVYTDIQGLKKLQYAKDQDAAKSEVAKQFEALLFQIVLRSMRDATKSFSSGLFSGNQMELYMDMFDKQLSLLMADSNVGIAKMIEKNMNSPHVNSATMPTALQIAADKSLQTNNVVTAKQKKNGEIKETEAEVDLSFASPEEFIKKLWATAKSAASYIGATPEILLAQAALETNWGKNILPDKQNRSSHNLFNIKAKDDWKNKTLTIDTIEHKNGIVVKEKSQFRMYDSFKESFSDYINLLKNNGRYSNVLTNATNPEKFIHAVQEAGYATDPDYAKKVLTIFSSKMFKNVISKVKNP